jgi:hypothetical protein
MSQGRSTQQLINVSMIVTCILAFIGIALLATFQHRNLGYPILLLAALPSFTYLFLRCRSCGLNVTKEADGSRTQRSTWPRANSECRKCGADIP